jgi:drug/metabolite transporter (DMT)-like permease
VLTVAQLLLLAALWGGSFLFMRVAAVEIGPAWIAGGRVLLAALFLAAVTRYLRAPLQLRSRWRHYLILGFFNVAFPFLLFAYAAQRVPASLLAVMNATAPIWGGAIAVLSGRETLSGRSLLGLALGVAGVAILVGFDPSLARPGSGPAVAAVLCAALCYGIASNYAAAAPSIPPVANAEGCMWASALLLLPALVLGRGQSVPSAAGIASVLALGLFCTGVAYVLYFRLIRTLGATPALSVTFLIPVFGILWGALFLGETVGWHTLIGAVVVVAGTMLVTGFNLRRLTALRRRIDRA